jgi:small subunit ribosomal protein S1
VSTPETVIDPAAEAPSSNGSSDLMIEVDGKLVPNYAATIKPFEEGDVVNGEVVRIDKDEVLVDIGYKSEGVIPSHELSIRRSVDPADEVDLGEQVDALVLTKEDQEGRLILSKKRARFEKAWRKIEAAAETGEPVEGSVIEVVKGGLILDLGVRGFLPASLVDIRRVHNLEEFRDQTLECKVIELNRSRNNVVLSRRAVLEEERKEVREQILERLQPGQIVEGKISNIVDFGAFVDLEGIDGLIHISELSWSHVNHPGEVLEIGQDVRVKVLDIDRDRQRISLGLKQTQEDPWQKVLNEYRQGDVLEGKVTKVVAFGAFIEIVPGVEGLVHISELAEHHVETPGEVVTPGEEKWVRILEIDEERRRISLSIKRAETKNNAFTDLIPDELKQQVQDASDDAAAAAAAAEAGESVETTEDAGESPEATEAVTEAATEAPADEVPDLGLSEDVFADAPVEPAPEEAPPSESDEG